MEQSSFKMKPRLFPNNDSICQIHAHTHTRARAHTHTLPLSLSLSLNCDSVLVVFQILL
jgi:hypothetical protein